MKLIVIFTIFLALSLTLAVPRPDSVEETSEATNANIKLEYLEKLVGKQLNINREEVHKFIKLLTELQKQSNTAIDESEQLKHFENFIGPRQEAHKLTKLIIGVMKEYANREENAKRTDETEIFLHYGEVLLETFSAMRRHFNIEADILAGLINVLKYPEDSTYSEKFGFIKEKYGL
ncbi:uncharacterized protein LOC132260686 [Phlebotomus argentipes]|uniref:uncharacterized protein LOC132260686 n=1 Tax=Phlebotomus argentipes TaxID=94469 RepID=UPI0028937194|nr:uncharacterized protein LOC132260686 [Phlebotomus argentipes]